MDVLQGKVDKKNPYFSPEAYNGTIYTASIYKCLLRTGKWVWGLMAM
jgi:hypothetical protein